MGKYLADCRFSPGILTRYALTVWRSIRSWENCCSDAESTDVSKTDTLAQRRSPLMADFSQSRLWILLTWDYKARKTSWSKTRLSMVKGLPASFVQEIAKIFLLFHKRLNDFYYLLCSVDQFTRVGRLSADLVQCCPRRACHRWERWIACIF